MKMLRNQLLPLLAALAAALTSFCSAVQVHPRNCGGTPKHVHLSVGHDPATQMIVSFASIPSNFPAPVGGVLIGTSPTLLTEVYIEEELGGTSYNVTVGRGGNYGSKYYSPYYHHVTISDLKPSTTYYYKPLIHASVKGFGKHNVRASNSGIGVTKEDIEAALTKHNDDLEEDDETDVRRRLSHGPYDGSDKECPSPDKIRSFTTAPLPGADASVNLAFMGDLGQFPHSEDTMKRLLRSKGELDAVILAGDLGYTGT
jgi:hypothetical protein